MPKVLQARNMAYVNPPVKVSGQKPGAFLCSKGHTLAGAGVSPLEWCMHKYYRARLHEASFDAYITVTSIIAVLIVIGAAFLLGRHG